MNGHLVAYHAATSVHLSHDLALSAARKNVLLRSLLSQEPCNFSVASQCDE